MADTHLLRLPPWRAALLLLYYGLLLGLLSAACAQDLDYPTAGLSTSWTSTPTMKHVVRFGDGSQVRSLLLRRNRAGYGHTCAFGFHCRDPCNAFLLAIFIVQSNSGGGITLPSSGFPQVVWAANRARPVGENATLRLGSDGDLVLRDADGAAVWSTDTSGKSVSGVSITEFGNLVLLGGGAADNNRTIIWDSFDHPTDSLVPGQRLLVGQRLAANASSTNATEGDYYLYANSSGLIPFVKSNPPTRYSSVNLLAQNGAGDNEKEVVKIIEYFEFMNGTITANSSSWGQHHPYVPPTQFLRLESDGHLRVYQWSWTTATWDVARDMLTPAGWATSNCFYPTACGRYGICSANQQCSCPQWNLDGGAPSANYFVQLDSRSPSSGCREVTPLSCPQKAYTNHSLLRLSDIGYFSYDDGQSAPSISSVNEAGCRDACAANCSCRAAFFRYFQNTTSVDGSCYLVSEVFSLKNNQPDVTHYNSSAFVKVQIRSPTPPPGGANSSTTRGPPGSSGVQISPGAIVGSVAGALFSLLLVAVCIILIRRRSRLSKLQRDGRDEEEEEEELEARVISSGMPRRFSLEELRAATDGFSKKLGQGGFGSVYEGSIADGTAVAVKRLDGLGQQGKKEFLAEVQTIGKVHHMNLVKLIGYCAAKSCRLLVYEFMPNGSLDRWIFPPRPIIKDDHYHGQPIRVQLLDWQTRCKIVLGVARGLCYLHEECSQRIAHLDIKPQNILLDGGFEAKVSDFGLAKLIERDQSHVQTRMRGTPGYLAPEWLSSMITEKADVYSFGVVILEIVCGRKNLDLSQPDQEDRLLVAVLKRKAESNDVQQLWDLVDESIKDEAAAAACHSSSNYNIINGEAVRMIQIARWCLQEHNRRPSMSTVVKALEGTVDVETHHLEEAVSPALCELESGSDATNGSTPLLPSILSGPR